MRFRGLGGRELDGDGGVVFEDADHDSEDGSDEVSDDVSTLRGMTTGNLDFKIQRDNHKTR